MDHKVGYTIYYLLVIKRGWLEYPLYMDVSSWEIYRTNFKRVISQRIMFPQLVFDWKHHL